MEDDNEDREEEALFLDLDVGKFDDDGCEKGIDAVGSSDTTMAGDDVIEVEEEAALVATLDVGSMDARRIWPY